MSAQEMKQILLEQIQNEEDESMLYNAIRFFNHDVQILETDIIYLTEEQKLGIEEARNEIKNGLGKSHYEVMKEAREWLNEEMKQYGEKD